jgi:hypothetical protein
MTLLYHQAVKGYPEADGGGGPAYLPAPPPIGAGLNGFIEFQANQENDHQGEEESREEA